ncbi:MAG: hypothetical protein MUC65_04515 [Pontiellaceae bacterium]|jgi:uncharacterized protein (TIGR02145 family)|nr:hypothetical protein [Pontiellaceae bacterium]
MRQETRTTDVETFTDPRDGNVYRTVRIAGQCWLAENLKYLPSVSPITTRPIIRLGRRVDNVSRTEPYYYVYGSRSTRVPAAKASAYYCCYGVLYNWPAAMKACPAGWHLPSDEEWTQLVEHLMAARGLLNDWVHTNGVGNALKSCRQIDSPLDGGHTIEHPRWESIQTPPPERRSVSVGVQPHYGTDAVGFSALPGGRLAYGQFSELGFHGFWWSSTGYEMPRAWYRMIRHEFGDVTRSNFDKAAGFSVRCIRD